MALTKARAVLLAALLCGQALLAGGDARADEGDAAIEYRHLSALVARGARTEHATQRWKSLRGMAFGLAITGFSAYGYSAADEAPKRSAAVGGMILGGLGLTFSTLGLVLGARGPLHEIELRAAARVSPLATPATRLRLLERDVAHAASVAEHQRELAGIVGLAVGLAIITVSTLFVATDTSYSASTRRVIGLAGYLLGVDRSLESVYDLSWGRTPVEETWRSWNAGSRSYLGPEQRQ